MWWDAGRRIAMRQQVRRGVGVADQVVEEGDAAEFGEVGGAGLKGGAGGILILFTAVFRLRLEPGVGSLIRSAVRDMNPSSGLDQNVPIRADVTPGGK